MVESHYIRLPRLHRKARRCPREVMLKLELRQMSCFAISVYAYPVALVHVLHFGCTLLAIVYSLRSQS